MVRHREQHAEGAAVGESAVLQFDVAPLARAGGLVGEGSGADDRAGSNCLYAGLCEAWVARADLRDRDGGMPFRVRGAVHYTTANRC